MIMRAVCPYYTRRAYRRCNRLLGLFLQGRTLARGINMRRTEIPRPDGSMLRVCIYTPKKQLPGAPGLLWLHGGGYAIGMPEQDVFFIRRYVVETGCVAVAPDYRLSTQAPYPAALEDCYAALLWLRDHCGEYAVSPDKLFVGGDSAGGGLTAAVSLLARDRGEVSVAFQMPLYPMLDDRMTTASVNNNDAPVWNTRSNAIAWQTYLGGKAPTKYAAPARETDYSGLPPTLTFVGGLDPFRDETGLYVKALRDAGVETHFRRFEGCFHGFDLLCFWTKPARQANAFMMDGFRYAVEHYAKAQPGEHERRRVDLLYCAEHDRGEGEA